jgi:hypothetical protein
LVVAGICRQSAGIDVDANGNVLVCDLVNHQVVEISPNGKQLSATPVPWPDRLGPQTIRSWLAGLHELGEVTPTTIAKAMRGSPLL